MLEAEGICKNFGSFQAVKDVSLSVQKGQVLGLLGANGAGKTTTMRMLTGYLVPDKGRIGICGTDITRQTQTAQQHIGYLPEGVPLYPDMRPIEFLEFCAHTRGMGKVATQNAIYRVVCDMNLQDVCYQTIDSLSKGYKRRVGFAQALLADPEVLILDEPTDGLDPNQKRDVRSLIAKISAQKAIIISTHILEEVSALCSDVVMIDKGQVIARNTPQGLAHLADNHNSVILILHSAHLSDAQKEIADLAVVCEVAIEKNTQDWVQLNIIPHDKKTILAEIAYLVHQRGWNVASMTAQQGHLDAVFGQLTCPQRLQA